MKNPLILNHPVYISFSIFPSLLILTNPKPDSAPKIVYVDIFGVLITNIIKHVGVLLIVSSFDRIWHCRQVYQILVKPQRPLAKRFNK